MTKTSKTSDMIVRDVPIELRRKFKAAVALDGNDKTMRGKIIELMEEYVAEKTGAKK